MLKKVFLFTVFLLNLYAISPSVEELEWPSKKSFLTFLNDNNIPSSLYYNLEKDDQELASEITSGTKFQILRDENQEISQILIPITEDLQIHIFKDGFNNYSIEFIPVVYEENEYILSLLIEKSPYQDIINQTNNHALAAAFMSAFKGGVDFRNLKKGDKLSIIFNQKTRLGSNYGIPNIKAAMIEQNGKPSYVYQYNDKFYDPSGKELERFFLIKPVKNARISSPFTLKRWHPILKRYKAHLGIDYAAPKGTKIYAAGDGVINFVGQKSGYGKVITIKHIDNYMTLYAHLSAFAKGIKNNTKVKQGQLIAYVGSTGMSTGPHLHFGLYKNKVAINPQSVVRVTKSALSGNQKNKFNAFIKGINDEIAQSFITNNKIPPKNVKFDLVETF